MISQASDYLFITGEDVDTEHPHGDLDRIILDGEIMPLREGYTKNVDKDENPIPKKNILRGEDISFLKEAYCERRAAAIGSWPPEIIGGNIMPPFSRKIDLDQPHDIAMALRGLPDSTPRLRKWLKTGETWPDAYNVENSWPPALYPNAFLAPEDVLSAPSDFVDRNVHLRRDKIETMFSDLEKFNRYQLDSTAVMSPAWSELTNSDWYFSGTGDGSSLFVSGSWCLDYHFSWYTRDGDDKQAHTDYNLTGTLRQRSITLSWDGLNYAKGIELWIRAYLTDTDTSRYPARSYSWRGLVKLGTIVTGALSGGTVLFPASYVTSLYERLLSRAAQDCGTGAWNDPFKRRTANEYMSHWDEIFGRESYGGNVEHSIAFRTEGFCGICELRDRTRWQSN